MAALSTLGQEREASEAHIKATAARLAQRFGVADPIAALDLRSKVYDDQRMTQAAAAAADRALAAGMLELMASLLESVFEFEEEHTHAD